MTKTTNEKCLDAIKTLPSSFQFYAEDYGRQAKRSIELAKSRGMWADIANARYCATRAAHFGAKELARREAVR